MFYGTYSNTSKGCFDLPYLPALPALAFFPPAVRHGKGCLFNTKEGMEHTDYSLQSFYFVQTKMINISTLVSVFVRMFISIR